MKRWQWCPSQQAMWGNGSYWEGDMDGDGKGIGQPFDDYVQGYTGAGETDGDDGDGEGCPPYVDESVAMVVARSQ